ncbi:MAG: hypothetical protein INH41_28115 [Myxococcaceae bacterium]|jgi:hypothetical protein|nr:hypothetical protein [Myxococcaceae bacterium]MCA3016267.1 hypothetical protein [Myxococcaceae bacterium]
MRALIIEGALVPAVALSQSLAEAEALYADGGLAAALKAPDAALVTAKGTLEVSKLQVLRGLVLLAVGKKDEAHAALSQALMADAARQLDTSRTPPAALALLEQAREALPPGSLAVSSTGSGVTLRIGGVDFGPLPLTTRISIGRNVLEAGAPGTPAMRAEVLVRIGEPRAVELAAPVERPSAVASRHSVCRKRSRRTTQRRAAARG